MTFRDWTSVRRCGVVINFKTAPIAQWPTNGRQDDGELEQLPHGLAVTDQIDGSAVAGRVSGVERDAERLIDGGG